TDHTKYIGRGVGHSAVRPAFALFPGARFTCHWFFTFGVPILFRRTAQCKTITFHLGCAAAFDHNVRLAVIAHRQMLGQAKPAVMQNRLTEAASPTCAAIAALSPAWMLVIGCSSQMHRAECKDRLLPAGDSETT